MSYRAAVILLKDNQIALIERHRAGTHYFTFPGGHVDEGETPEQAAIRETMEELGLQVNLKQLVARLEWHGKPQYYFLAEITGGTFGTGTGEELTTPHAEKGTYHPVWVPLSELLNLPIKPRQMAELVIRFVREGWPKTPIISSELSD